MCAPFFLADLSQWQNPVKLQMELVVATEIWHLPMV